MRQYFDEDEEPATYKRRETEVTVGAGAVFGLCLALAFVCALCFGWGYSVGHRSSDKTAATTASATPAPDQEPLQGNDAIAKPSAAETFPPQTDASANAAGAAAPASESANPAANAPIPAQAGQNGQAAGAVGSGGAQVQPALPGSANSVSAAQPGAAPNVHAALPNQVQLMVQIAAVANTEDAEVLETALRKRGYPVTGARDPADGLIHVRIGPFTSQNEALRWRDKLLGDGYNAEVQP